MHKMNRLKTGAFFCWCIGHRRLWEIWSAISFIDIYVHYRYISCMYMPCWSGAAFPRYYIDNNTKWSATNCLIDACFLAVNSTRLYHMGEKMKYANQMKVSITCLHVTFLACMRPNNIEAAQNHVGSSTCILEEMHAGWSPTSRMWCQYEKLRSSNAN